MFLHIVGHNQRFRVIKQNWRRSIETVHRHFKEVLYAIGELRQDMIRPPTLSCWGFPPWVVWCCHVCDRLHWRSTDVCLWPSVGQQGLRYGICQDVWLSSCAVAEDLLGQALLHVRGLAAGDWSFCAVPAPVKVAVSGVQWWLLLCITYYNWWLCSGLTFSFI